MFFLKNQTKEEPLQEQSDQENAVSDKTSCRRVLDEVLSQKKAKGAVLKLYLENFKLFNDTFAYDYGELFLQEVIAYLNGIENAQVFRSGVEFIILLEGQSYSDALDTAHRIQERFENAWRIRGMDYMCAMAMGMVVYPDMTETSSGILKCLDCAVREAEQMDQNQIAVYDSRLQAKNYRRHAIAQLIKDSLSHPEQLELRYRPTYSVDDKKFTRAESYLTLHTEEFGLVGAKEFIPIAEDSGLICAVNNYAIRQVCRKIRELLDADIAFETLAVPVSPILLLQERFLDDVRDMMEEYNVPAEKLAFEMTESILISSLNKVNLVMEDLSQMGVEIVLNEFGTGYSGINNILALPVNVVKLERMFVLELETNPKSGYVIEGLIHMAKMLGLKLIAEGVETQKQVDMLAEYGCKYEQGFFYSATVASDELAGTFAL